MEDTITRKEIIAFCKGILKNTCECLLTAQDHDEYSYYEGKMDGIHDLLDLLNIEITYDHNGKPIID